MNHLKGVIQRIEADEDISLIEVLVQNSLFSALTMDKGFKVGDNVIVGFKETAMSIGKDTSGEFSIRNRFDLTVKSFTRGRVLTKVIVDFQGQELVSVITTASAERMKINTHDQVEGMVKTTDMVFIKT
jgi:molybdopterin-binding protein